MVTVKTAENRRVSDKDRDAIQWAKTIQSASGWELNKYPFERQWMVNISFLQGFQDIRWDKETHRPVANRLPRHRSSYVANKILHMAEKAQAEMCESVAKWTTKARPGSGHNGRVANRVAKRVLTELWDDLNMTEEKIPEMVMWALACGTGFLYNTTKADPRTKQRIYVNPQNGETIAPSMLGDGMKAYLDQAGAYLDYMAPNPDVQVTSPFRLLFDPNAPSIKAARTMQHWSSMSIDEAYEKWGIVVPRVGLPTGMLEYEARLRSFFGPATGTTLGVSGSSAPELQTTAIQEVISKPYVVKKHGKWEEYPEGRHVILAGGVVVHDDINGFYAAGYENGFPVTEFCWHKMPGRIWGEAPISQWLDGQKAYNDVRRREQDNFRVMGQPKWISPFGANLKRKSINDVAGEVIEYNFMGGGKPEQVTPTPYHPQIVGGLAQNAMTDLQDSASQHNILASSTPSEMRAGPMMELAREGDRLAKRPIVGRMERCIGAVGENLLITTAEIMDETGIIELVGDEIGIGAETFKVSILKNIKSVKVKRGSMEAGSAATDAQKALDAVQVGALNPGSNASDRAVFLEAMNYGGYDPDITAVNMEREVALRENDGMFAMPGMPDFAVPQIGPTDDDVVHAQTHAEAIRSHQFKLLPPSQQQIALGHYQEHGQRLQQAAADQERRTLVSKGAPGPKGTPSPPKQSSK
jgi:hypothetical protein